MCIRDRVDPATGRLYVDVQTDEHGIFIHRLHVLDVASGAEVPGSPVTVRATAPGFPGVDFHPHTAFQRSGLALDRGIVYVPYASNDDARGWMIGFDAATLDVVRVFCVTPKGALGGIWEGGAAPAVDDGGDLYVSTGNGAFNAAVGGPNHGMSVLRLAATNQLNVVDYFAPYNERPMSRRDGDLGSGGVMLLPDHPGPHRREAVTGGKEGRLFVLDRDALGTFHRDGNHVVQQLDANLRNGYYSSPAYFGGAVYYAANSAHLDRYAIHLSLIHISQRVPPLLESGFAPMLAYCFVFFCPLQSGIGALSGAAKLETFVPFRTWDPPHAASDTAMSAAVASRKESMMALYIRRRSVSHKF